MRLLNIFNNYRISSKKFYQIVTQYPERTLPQTPEQAIISKYLKDDTYQPKQVNVVKAPSNQKRKFTDYREFIGSNPHGSIIQKTYKQVSLGMMSLSYQNIEQAEVYKVCQKFDPDLVFMQARPQNYIPLFQLLKKDQNGVFSDMKYLEQLIVKSESLQQNILTPAIKGKLNEIIFSEKKVSAEKIFIKDNKDIVEDQVVVTGSFYANKKNKHIIFGQIPEQPWRQWICNSHSLMELQQMFKGISKNIPFYQSLKMTPAKIANILKPQLFLNLQDRYMSTLLEMVIATGRYKSIMMIMGLMQNQAVDQILSNQMHLRDDKSFVPIIEYLIGPEIKHNLIKDVEGWQIIQKHILIDVLQHGQAVINQPLLSFATTNKIIEHYGIKMSKYSQQTIMKFRFDKTIQYVQLMKKQIVEGEELKRKFMLREAIRVGADDL